MTKWSEKNGIEFWTMPKERATEGLEVLRAGFFPDEIFCCSTGINEDPEGQKELENLCLDTALDGISIMAIDKETNKIVAVAYNKLQTALQPGQKGFFDEFIDTKCKSKTGKNLIKMMIKFDSFVDLYAKYNATCGVEIMFLGTHPDYRKRGLATECVKSSLSLAKTLTSPKPTIATALFSSPFSIKAGRSLHFDEVLCVPLEETVCEGIRFSDHPKAGKNHPGTIVMVKRL